MKQGPKPDLQSPTLAVPKDMSSREIDQFLTCGRVGRLGMILPEGGPYIVPVGYGYGDGKIYFHTCSEGLKMEIIQANPNVCFEVDESISDCSLAKSVIILGRAEILSDKKEMIPYLEKLIDKYRVPVSFGEYMRKGKRDVQEEASNIMKNESKKPILKVDLFRGFQKIPIWSLQEGVIPFWRLFVFWSSINPNISYRKGGW